MQPYPNTPNLPDASNLPTLPSAINTSNSSYAPNSSIASPPVYAPPQPLPSQFAELSPPVVALPARKIRKWPAIIVFCLFAALIPETIATSSTAVLAIILSPINLLFISLFYGPADLLIREAIIRRRVGVASMLLFGCAFGFINEGVVAGTWYKVQPTGYLFFGSIDWAWAVSLTVFHIFISVMLPVAFFALLFPKLADQPLLRRRGMIIAAIIFFGLTSLIALAPAYRAQRFVVLLVAILLGLLALRLAPKRSAATASPQSVQPMPQFLPPASFAYAPAVYAPPPAPIVPAPAPLSRPAPRLWMLRIAGFLAFFGYFLLIYLLPVLVLPLVRAFKLPLFISQIIDAAVLILLVAAVVRGGHAWLRRAGWSPRHTLALITGVAVFCALVSLIPQQILILEPLATFPFLLLLLWLNRRTKRWVNQSSQQSSQ